MFYFNHKPFLKFIIDEDVEHHFFVYFKEKTIDKKSFYEWMEKYAIKNKYEHQKSDIENSILKTIYHKNIKNLFYMFTFADFSNNYNNLFSSFIKSKKEEDIKKFKYIYENYLYTNINNSIFLNMFFIQDPEDYILKKLGSMVDSFFYKNKQVLQLLFLNNSKEKEEKLIRLKKYFPKTFQNIQENKEEYNILNFEDISILQKYEVYHPNQLLKLDIKERYFFRDFNTIEKSLPFIKEDIFYQKTKKSDTLLHKILKQHDYKISDTLTEIILSNPQGLNLTDENNNSIYFLLSSKKPEKFLWQGLLLGGNPFLLNKNNEKVFDFFSDIEKEIAIKVCRNTFTQQALLVEKSQNNEIKRKKRL